MTYQDPHTAEVRRLAELLACAIRQKGIPRRVLEAKMGLERGALSELLSGDGELHLRDLLRILEVLELHPWHFFRVAFNRPRVRTGSAGDPGAEEELVAALRSARPSRAAELSGIEAPNEEPSLAAGGNGGSDPARGVLGSS